jgi:hypothetical protein
MGSSHANQSVDPSLTPEEVLARFRRLDELYVIGKAQIWDGFRRERPDATWEELQEMWMAYLEERRRGKWGGP